MRLFTRKNKLISIVREDCLILPVLNRFGIQPGLQDYTIEEICTTKNINIDFFLAIINTYLYPHYFPQKELTSFNPELIISYLLKTHEYYTEYMIPALDKSFQSLLDNTSSESDIHLIQKLYENFKHEFLAHNQSEEDSLFPYIKKMMLSPSIADGRLTHETFEKEHLQIDDKINDLKNLLLKYIQSDYDTNLYNEFICKLSILEKDSHDHSRIEDAILLPIARNLEKDIRNDN
ncbi:MAG: hemerythrin domain-containing protein [Bacteroidales bacterium]